MSLPKLHILTDTSIQSRFSHYELAEKAFSAGDVAVQYRNKNFDSARDLEELMAIAALSRSLSRVLIINDDVQLAFQVGAQGVHLGQGDGSVKAARALLGSEAIIGATVHNEAELKALRQTSVNYIGVGPIYGTTSKVTGLPKLGLDGLQALGQMSPWAVIGIGGIGTSNAQEVLNHRADGFAVLSEFCTAEEPQKIAKQLLDILADWRKVPSNG